jgi:prepilin-type N-terminal cleavage/methylation domain-containing protein
VGIAASHRRAASGFTLLELIAVVLIIGLMATLVRPNLGILGARSLHDEAQRLAAELEFARQRTVMMGVRHQLVLNLDDGNYWTEWEAPSPEEPASSAGVTARSVALSPPERGFRRFTPLPGGAGRRHSLGDEAGFVEIAAGGLPVDSGTFRVAFDNDGTADPTTIVLGHPKGARLALEVRALADAVWIRDDTR